MKKQVVLLAALLGGTLAGYAQKKGFDYKFYGQVRTDLFYNSRSNSETVDGLFYMYPLDKVEDPNGKDLNDNGNSDFYTLYTRLGVDVTGPMLRRRHRRRSRWISAVRVLHIRSSASVTCISTSTGASRPCWSVRLGIRSMAMWLPKY